jgi:ABC-type multidrug transport system fused ATPase/permease subunit
MSGEGKTTIVNLVLRFYDPTKGRILLDGKDLRDLKIEGMRLCMSAVSQEGFLFTGSIMDNIRMGRLDASDNDVVESARKTGAIGFIQNLPDGFQTIIGEQGIKLSGGQKQLIAITRAQLRTAPIILLDEPTSAMDSETESLVQKSLEQVSRNRAMLIIAHRLSTILRADEILVLRNGIIVERGTHRELLEHGTFYKHVYHLQFEQFEKT